MPGERRLWLGNLVIAAVMFVVAAVPIREQVADWILVALAVAIAVAFVLLFPWHRRDGGDRTMRLIDRVRVSGSRNRVQVAGDNANQYMADGSIQIEHGPANDGDR